MQSNASGDVGLIRHDGLHHFQVHFAWPSHLRRRHPRPHSIFLRGSETGTGTPGVSEAMR